MGYWGSLQEHTMSIPTFDFVPWSGGEQRSVHDDAIGRPLVWESRGAAA